MAVLLRLAGQTLGDGLHGCFAVAIARRISPIEDGADALADAARGLRFRQPDFRQEVADHRAGYLVDANIADMGEGIIAKALLPLRLVLLVLPSFPMSRQNLGGGFATGRDALRLPALQQRVQSQLALTANFPRSLAGIAHADRKSTRLNSSP